LQTDLILYLKRSKNRSRNRDTTNKNKINKDFRAQGGGRETKFQSMEFKEAPQKSQGLG
jgi:hypothetical protein